jgi:hypothetical protein
MKVIIAGSRGITDINHIYEAVEKSNYDIDQIVSGTAKGVDQLGEKFAEDNGIPIKRFPAKWNDLSVKKVLIKEGRYGKYNALAGFQRNAAMADYADALIAIWDGKSNGTRNMINLMKSQGKLTFILEVI